MLIFNLWISILDLRHMCECTGWEWAHFFYTNWPIFHVKSDRCRILKLFYIMHTLAGCHIPMTTQFRWNSSQIFSIWFHAENRQTQHSTKSSKCYMCVCVCVPARVIIVIIIKAHGNWMYTIIINLFSPTILLISASTIRNRRKFPVHKMNTIAPYRNQFD